MDEKEYTSIIQTLRYSDYFDYPITLDELHNNLDFKITKKKLEETLVILHDRNIIGTKDGYYFFKGRDGIVDIRKHRSQISMKHWEQVRIVQKLLSKLPFIELVAVTGSLSLNNNSGRSDIDLFVVAQEHRVWLLRMILFFCQKYLEKQFRNPVHLCFNYITSKKFTSNFPRNIYVARELVQMKPILGTETYIMIIKENSWITDFLVNMDIAKHLETHYQSEITTNESLGNKILNYPPKIIHRILSTLDYLEYRRATAKIYRNFALTHENNFVRNEYKAHFSNHQLKLLENLAQIDKTFQKVKIT